MTVTMRKPPKAREYAPKVMDPGQPATWKARGEITRTGTVWSKGPSAASWWVSPDDAPLDAVLVRGRGGYFWEDTSADWRALIRRAENVRRRGVYAVRASWGGTLWHADPDCPQAAGGERRESALHWTAGDIAAILAGGRNETWHPHLCRTCIMLEPEAAMEGQR